MKLEERVKNLEDRVDALEKCEGRCEVCGMPTNGWIKTLFGRKHYYCGKHHPRIGCQG